MGDVNQHVFLNEVRLKTIMHLESLLFFELLFQVLKTVHVCVLGHHVKCLTVGYD